MEWVQIIGCTMWHRTFKYYRTSLTIDHHLNSQIMSGRLILLKKSFATLIYLWISTNKINATILGRRTYPVNPPQTLNRLTQEWQNIPQATIIRCIGSMRTLCQAWMSGRLILLKKSFATLIYLWISTNKINATMSILYKYKEMNMFFQLTFFNNGPNILKSIVRVCIYYSKLALLTSNYLLLVMAYNASCYSVVLRGYIQCCFVNGVSCYAKHGYFLVQFQGKIRR
jgi:hypothetical protein